MCGLVCTIRDRYPISLYCNAYCCSMPLWVLCPNHGYEVGGVAVAVAVKVEVAVAVTVGERDGVNVAVGGCALILEILGAIHNA